MTFYFPGGDKRTPEEPPKMKSADNGLARMPDYSIVDDTWRSQDAPSTGDEDDELSMILFSITNQRNILHFGCLRSVMKQIFETEKTQLK